MAGKIEYVFLEMYTYCCHSVEYFYGYFCYHQGKKSDFSFSFTLCKIGTVLRNTINGGESKTYHLLTKQAVETRDASKCILVALSCCFSLTVYTLRSLVRIQLFVLVFVLVSSTALCLYLILIYFFLFFLCIVYIIRRLTSFCPTFSRGLNIDVHEYSVKNGRDQQTNNVEYNQIK